MSDSHSLLLASFSSFSKSPLSSAYSSTISTPNTSVYSEDLQYFDKEHRGVSEADEYFSKHERDPELWFDDGNLILQAENTIFKIYRGHLSARSSVFRDMFEFPPPAEGNRMIDGIPVVDVYDEADDMRYFLKAILDSEFFEPPPTPTTLHIARSILKLSTKYDVPYLRTRALAHLNTTYPSTLSGWKQRDAARTIPGVENTPFAVLKVASAFGLEWLVPSVVYCICSHSIEKTLDGAAWEWGGDGNNCDRDETGGKEDEEEDEEEENRGRKGERKVKGRVEMDADEKRMCLIARNQLLLTQNAYALSIVRHERPADAPLCVDPEGGAKCHETRLRIADILTRWGTPGFLDFYEEQYEAFAGGLCKVCLQDFKETHAHAVQDYWDALPGFCGFEGGWTELERVRGLVSPSR